MLWKQMGGSKSSQVTEKRSCGMNESLSHQQQQAARLLLGRGAESLNTQKHGYSWEGAFRMGCGVHDGV